MEKIVEPLLGWFRENKRPLPWRNDREPYHVWISEIMLQQTRIEAVMRYYARFMEALPDVASLSEVPEDQLLKPWEGLGYYSRARNLKKAAAVVMEEDGGVFPDNFRALLRLPGVGEYTAGAIASICFDEKVPAVDGNVLRVVSRVLGSRKDVLLPETKREVDGLLREIMPDEAGAFNEALMELGELVCLPGGLPACEQCPLRPHCAAYRDGLTGELPVRVKKTRRRREEKTVLLLVAPDGRVAIEKRPDKGLLSGLYQLPNLDGFLEAAEWAAALKEWGLTPVESAFAGEAKHVFTHLDWFMKGWRVTVAAPDGRFLWATPDELRQTYALPTAFQPFVRRLFADM